MRNRKFELKDPIEKKLLNFTPQSDNNLHKVIKDLNENNINKNLDM